MSTTLRTSRTRLVLVAASLVVALVGGIASASAQSNGGGRGGGSGNSNGSGGGSDVIVYGTPGNCPPTIGCGSETQRPRPSKPKVYRQRDLCGDHLPESPAYRRCMGLR